MSPALRGLPFSTRRSGARCGWSSILSFEISFNGREILVAAAGQVHHHQMTFRLLRRDLGHFGEGMRGLECWNDALELAAKLKRRHRLVVCRGKKFHAAHVVQPSVLGTDAGVVETSRNRVRLFDLAIVVHSKVGAIAVQHTGSAAGNRGRMLAVESMASRLDAVDLD